MPLTTSRTTYSYACGAGPDVSIAPAATSVRTFASWPGPGRSTSGVSARRPGRAQDRLIATVDVDPPMPADDPLTQAVASDRAETVRRALEVLPDSQREAVVLAYWGGLTAEEISRRVDVPLGTVKSRIRLGLAKLRTTVGELMPEPELV